MSTCVKRVLQLIINIQCNPYSVCEYSPDRVSVLPCQYELIIARLSPGLNDVTVSGMCLVVWIRVGDSHWLAGSVCDLIELFVLVCTGSVLTL